MFPLGSVLLPTMVLPLHVFEPRYRELVRRCLAGDGRFGVTLIERGSEVGGGDIRAMAGTVAEIVRAQERPDGRWAVVAVGTERVRVHQWLPDDPHPRALVEDWPDEPSEDDDELAERYRAVVRDLRRVLALAVELGAEADPMVELSRDPTEGSYQLAVVAPLGALDRQRLLTCPGPDARLALAAELLVEQSMLLEARLVDLGSMDGDGGGAGDEDPGRR
jgi:Lon protease-like protein